jgi:GH18 family chitinase
MNIRIFLCAAPALATLLLPGCGSTVDAPVSSAGFGTAGSSSAGTAPAAGASSAGTGPNGGTSPGGLTSNGGSAGAFADQGGSLSLGGAGGSTGGTTLGGAGGAAGGKGTGGSTATDGPAIKAVMYLPNWAGGFAPWAAKLDFSKMTHLDLAFGTIKGTNDWSLGASDQDVQAIAAAAHAKNVKVLVSIGGADDDLPIIQHYQTEANIEPMVTNLDAFITRLHLDGVDVDLERGNGLTAASNFPKFLSALIAKLRPQGRVVSTALAQYIIEDTKEDATKTAWLSSYDFINLMIYNTNMSTYTKELGWWTSTRNVAKNKLTWGVEFSAKTSVDYAKQLTTASKAYGGIMAWELSQPTAPPLWKAIQDTL